MLKDEKNINKISVKFKKYIDFVLIFLLAFLSIKKGGFYKNDNLEFNLIVTFIGTVYIVLLYIKNILKKYIKKKNETNLENITYTNSIKIKNKIKIKFDVIEILLLLLSFAYLLPIIFNNYSNLSDSIFEMIRYFNIYLIYVIIKNSNNKKLYLSSLNFIVFIQCILGIDGLANRYLLPLLDKLNSGYLTNDNLTRMSGTIQYANVFSLLCVLANIYLLDKLKSKDKLKLKEIIDYLCIFVFTSSIILSKSRVVLLVLICYLLYIFISKKTINKHFIIINILLSIVYTNIFMKLLLSNVNLVYLLTVIFYIIICIIYLLRTKIQRLLTVIKNVLFKKEKNKKIICISLILVVCTYIILSLLVKVPIKIDSNVNQNYVLRNIYSLKENDLNEVSIKIKKEDEDSRYKIEIFEVNNNFESTLIKTYNYYSTTTDIFKFEYLLHEDISHLMIKITCEKNSIQVLQILVNNKANYIDYLLLPTDTVYRVIESLNGDSSINGRLCFVKDAFALITSNIKNFLIGLGGEGFKNTYELVKSGNYHSTEVHNVYLQIFVETGVIGFGVFITLVIIALKNTKFNIVKLLFIIFCVTSIFDLNFSYMFSMSVFAILLALLKEKDENEKKEIYGEFESKEKSKNKNKDKILKLFDTFKVILVFIYSTSLVVILINASLAYYMKVPKTNTVSVQYEEISKFVKKYEKRVNKEPYEIGYRYSLHLEYKKYLEILNSYLEDTKLENNNISESEEKIEILKIEYVKTVKSMEDNLLQMLKFDKYDEEVLTQVTSEIIEYLDILVKKIYPFDKDAGYSFYLDIVLQNIEKLNRFNYNKEAKEAYKTLLEYCYNTLILTNLKNESKVIQKYIDILNNKIVY